MRYLRYLLLFSLLEDREACIEEHSNPVRARSSKRRYQIVEEHLERCGVEQELFVWAAGRFPTAH